MIMVVKSHYYSPSLHDFRVVYDLQKRGIKNDCRTRAFWVVVVAVVVVAVVVVVVGGGGGGGGSGR